MDDIGQDQLLKTIIKRDLKIRFIPRLKFHEIENMTKRKLPQIVSTRVC